MRYSKFLLVLIILFVPIVIYCSGDSEKITKPVEYKKVFVFFPIYEEMPDFIKNSIFGKQYDKAFELYNEAQKKLVDYEFVTDVPEYAQNFVQKGINDFEKHYEFHLNKNYVKKMKLLLINPSFYFFFLLGFAIFFILKKQFLVQFLWDYLYITFL